MFFVGLDIHKNFIYGTVLNDESEIVNQGRFGTSEKEFDDFLGFLPNKQVKIVLESCGIWEDFYDLLESKGYSVCLANPLKVKAIASAKIKNDKVDSEILAKLLKANLIPESYVPPKEVRELRVLVRHRKSLVTYRTQLKNSIHAVLRKKNIKHPFTCLYTKKGVAFLKGMSNGQINTYLRLMDSVNAEIEYTNKILQKNSTLSKEVYLLQTMPGIGRYSAQVIISEIGNIKRFATPKKLCSYAGIVPSQSQSGDKDFRGRITKVGSRNLRWVLTQCAFSAVAQQGKLQKSYYRLARRKNKMKAIIATARKMLTIQWHMLTNNEPYLS